MKTDTCFSSRISFRYHPPLLVRYVELTACFSALRRVFLSAPLCCSNKNPPPSGWWWLVVGSSDLDDRVSLYSGAWLLTAHHHPYHTSGTAVSSRVMASYRLLPRPHTPPAPNSPFPPARLIGRIAPLKTNIGLIPYQKGQLAALSPFHAARPLPWSARPRN